MFIAEADEDVSSPSQGERTPADREDLTAWRFRFVGFVYDHVVLRAASLVWSDCGGSLSGSRSVSRYESVKESAASVT